MLALPAGAFGQTEAPPAQTPGADPDPGAGPAAEPDAGADRNRRARAACGAAADAVARATTASRTASAENRRHSVRMMEAVLSRAVLGGAEQLAEQLGNGSPNMSFFTGQARAHGFVLDGYGVFFHVEIPEMQQSLVMSVTTLERDLAVGDTLESLRRAVGAVPEGASKLQAEEALKRLELQVGPMPAARRCAGRRGPQHDSHGGQHAGVRPRAGVVARPARSERRRIGRPSRPP